MEGVCLWRLGGPANALLATKDQLVMNASVATTCLMAFASAPWMTSLPAPTAARSILKLPHQQHQ